MLRSEIANVFTDLVNLLAFSAADQVVRSVGLVGCDKVRAID